MVAAAGFNPAAFPGHKGKTIPDSILTTANTTTAWTVCAILAKSPLDAANIYKCFSNTDISLQVPTLFADVKEVLVHHWPVRELAVCVAVTIQITDPPLCS